MNTVAYNPTPKQFPTLTGYVPDMTTYGVVSVAVTLWACIQEVMGSNVG
jgi:hypothetical protein